MKLLGKLALASLTASVLAHPGGHEEQGLAPYAKRELHAASKRSLEKCSKQLEERGVNERALARRKATIEKYGKRLALRDTAAAVNTSHESNRTNITPNTPEEVIFGTSSTCILNPEGEVGPYWVKGEYIRSHIGESQPGVPIILEGQFLDVETCEPIQGLWWDLWNCNSTGVYAGVVAEGNGNIDDTANINTTFLRGIQQTDADGVVQFHSVFPGHYTGRTTHHHVIARLNATVLPNNTITGGNVAHIGQIFWDQDLIYAIEATAPYNTNNITITTNAVDNVVIDETTNSTSDPFINYVLLGDTLADGLFGWITFAVNTSASYDPTYSFELTSSGGVEVDGE